MPSGKKARQQRQAAVAAPPPVRSTGGTGTRQASPKVLGIAGVVVLVIVAVVLGVVLSNRSSGSSNGSGDSPNISIAAGTPKIGNSATSNLQGATETAKLLKGIPQDHFVLGSPTAPVTLVEYIDLQCPICGQFETTEFGPLVDKYVRTGKLKIIIQPWSILDQNPGEYDSLRGQKATIAAAGQNKAFNFAQVLYDNQSTEHTHWLNDAMISNIAASVDGLDTSQLAKDANGGDVKKVIQTITDFANSHPSEMTGTPTLFLGKGSQTPKYFTTGDPGLGNISAAIDALLTNK